MIIRTLDELSPTETVFETAQSPAGLIIIALIVLLLIAAFVVIVIKARKKTAQKPGTALSENEPSEDKKAP